LSLTPGVAGSNDTVCVGARITGDSPVASVVLTYARGAVQSQTNTVFQETMSATECKPWNGDGCANAWTVAGSGGNPFEQRGGANCGGGNTNGLEFKLGTSNLTDSTVTTAQGIDARGTSGYLEFWLWADGLSGSMGWTMQFGNASGYSTRLSELTGANHGWQLYHYDLQPQDLVSNLFLRFQFRGGAGDPRIDLDSLSLRVVSASSGGFSVAMLDDGAHQDGVAGDGIYGAFIPLQAAGTVVHYYLSATDSIGATCLSPTTAPATTWSYTVLAAAPDSVGDGIPDWWRARHFGGFGRTTNSVSCASCDPDGDGVVNYVEYIADTNPSNAASYFIIEGVSYNPGYAVFFQSSPNRKYTLEFTTNVSYGAWSSVPSQTGISGSGGMDALTDPSPTGPQRFYRIGVGLP
jgi:hypothetical protein